MSDEDDYMSDAFLQQIPDTRPGLVPKHVARVHKQEKKVKQANETNKKKPKAVLEREKRDAGLGVALSTENKGFSLLQKMGYKPGTALGKTGTGRTEPVPVEVKLGRGGLGRDSDQKRKQSEKQERLKHMSYKRQRMESQRKQDFMSRMNKTFANKTTDKDLYNSQKVCEQLDSQLGIAAPHEEFFWPTALLPSTATDDDDGGGGAHSDEPLERLQSGFNNYVGDEEEEEGDEEEKDNYKEVEEEEDEEVHRPTAYTAEEMLEVLTLYLRTKHKYCVWCGTKYDDKEDLMSNCPGNSAELHDD